MPKGMHQGNAYLSPSGPIPTPRPKVHRFVGFRTDGLGSALQSGAILYRLILVCSARWFLRTTGLFASTTAIRERLIVRGMIAGCMSCSAGAEAILFHFGGQI
jgi:hypothetical protein